MNQIQLRDLAVMTIKNPANAARIVMATRFPREALWTTLALAAVLNTLMFCLSDLISPAPSPFPAIFQVPVFYLAVIGFGLVASVYALLWIGGIMGGQGNLDEIMSLLIWLQAMRIAVQAVVIVLSVTIPVLAVLLSLAASLMGVYITLHFVNEAHRFGSLGRSAFVLIGSAVGIVVFVSILLTLVGGTLMGSQSYV